MELDFKSGGADVAECKMTGAEPRRGDDEDRLSERSGSSGSRLSERSGSTGSREVRTKAFSFSSARDALAWLPFFKKSLRSQTGRGGDVKPPGQMMSISDNTAAGGTEDGECCSTCVLMCSQ